MSLLIIRLFICLIINPKYLKYFKILLIKAKHILILKLLIYIVSAGVNLCQMFLKIFVYRKEYNIIKLYRITLNRIR